MILEVITPNNNITTKCKNKKLKKKKNYNKKLKIDNETLKLFEELNNQIDKEMRDALKNIKNVF